MKLPQSYRGTPFQKFVEVHNDERYIQFMVAEVWEHDDIYHLYFLYLNLIFVISAFSNTFLPLLAIDIVSVFGIEFISVKARSQIVGERLLQSVLKNEENRANKANQARRRANGQVISEYFNLMKKRQQ